MTWAPQQIIPSIIMITFIFLLTYPTKLKSTLSTGHMIAAFAFLYRAFTFRARVNEKTLIFYIGYFFIANL